MGPPSPHVGGISARNARQAKSFCLSLVGWRRMHRYPPAVLLAIAAAAFSFHAFAVFGVIFLTEGKTATGLVLLACVAVGVPTLIGWLRRFR